MPLHARVFAACVVGYAFSPIDPIPALGYLVLIPLGVTLAIKVVPEPVLAECREKARRTANEKKPASRVAAAVIVATWLSLAALAIFLLARLI